MPSLVIVDSENSFKTPVGHGRTTNALTTTDLSATPSLDSDKSNKDDDDDEDSQKGSDDEDSQKGSDDEDSQKGSDDESEYEESDDEESFTFDVNRKPPKNLTTTTKKKAHERSIRYASLQTPDLYKRTKHAKAAKEPQPTEHEIEIWRNEAVMAMAKESQAPDLLTCYMLMGRGGVKMTPWQNDMSMFFMVAFVIGVTPYQLILGLSNEAATTLQLQKIADGDEKMGPWRLPKIPNLSFHLRTVLNETYKTLRAKWDDTKGRIEGKYTVDGQQTITLPDCPSETKFTTLVYKGRNLMWKLWWGHKDSCRRDVRAEVVTWAATNLMKLKTTKEFKEAMDTYWEEGLVGHKLEYEEAHPTIKKVAAADGKADKAASPFSDEDESEDESDKDKDKDETEDGKDKGTEDDEEDNIPLTELKRRAKVKAAIALRLERKKAIKANLEKKRKATQDLDGNTKKKGLDGGNKVLDGAGNNTKKNLFLNENEGKVTTTEGKDEGHAKKQQLSEEMVMQQLQDKLKETLANLEKDDAVLGRLLREWVACMEHAKNPDCHRQFTYALRGIMAGSTKDIWLRYHGSGNHDLEPPARSHRGSTEYLVPSTDFKCMAKDVMRVMNALLVECDARGLRIIRYYWEYHLMKGMRQLTMEEMDPQMRLRGMYSCLVLSAATTDFDAINGAIKLFECGLLDSVDALADAPMATIIGCIKECGIHNKRAAFLKRGFVEIRDNHNGMIPQTLPGLEALPGVGRKTATLLLNEGYGFFAGIGTDKHVCNVATALGLFSRTFGLQNSAPSHVEDSLRTWITQPHFKDTNKIFGSMAQLVTQQLSNPKSDQDLSVMASALTERFHSCYELELIWYIIAKLRKHYKVVVEKRTIAQNKNEEESDDEDEAEEKNKTAMEKDDEDEAE